MLKIKIYKSGLTIDVVVENCIQPPPQNIFLTNSTALNSKVLH